jgi:hypothetical protein
MKVAITVIRKKDTNLSKIIGFVKEVLFMYLAVDWSNRRRLLREVAFCGDPTGEAEEALASPAESEATAEINGGL